MTHAALVERAAAWLAGTRRCVLVLTEYRCEFVAECPDAIGFTARGQSILAECKSNRADFLRDARKRHRKGLGLGAQRFYLVAPGVATPEDVPESWGLVEVGARCRVLREAPVRVPDTKAERDLLLSVSRRATGYVPRPLLKSGIAA